MNIFLISPVRTKVSDEEQEAINTYVAALRQEGHRVYWPLYDTDQIDGVGLRICTDNLRAIESADRVDFWWTPTTQGGIFDFGMDFALRKKIVLANPDRISPPPAGKSFLGVLLALAYPDPKDLARFLRRFSTCPKAQTAAVVVRDGEILSFGWNVCIPKGVKSNPQGVVVCPRMGLPPGASPELCNSVCAEKTSLLNIRSRRKLRDYRRCAQHIPSTPELIADLFTPEELACFAGGTLFITGHWWAHPNCEAFAELCGIRDIVIDGETAEDVKKNR